MTDGLVLTASQIRALEDAFRRYDWTASQVDELCRGDALGRFRDIFSLKPVLEQTLSKFFSAEMVGRYGLRPGWNKIAEILEVDGIKTLQELVRISERDLQRTPHIGTRYVSVIKAMLATHGLRLGMDSS